MCYRKIARVCTGASNHAEDSIGAVSSKSCCVQIHIEVVKQVFSYPLEHEVLCSCSYKDASRILSCHASQCVELLCCNIACWESYVNVIEAFLPLVEYIGPPPPLKFWAAFDLVAGSREAWRRFLFKLSDLPEPIASSSRVDRDSFLQHYLSEFCHSEAHDYEFYSGPCRVP